MNARAEQFENVETLRTPPQAAEAEQAVLGGLMCAPDSLLKVCEWLKEDDFYRRDHRLIYRGILELNEKKKPFDSVTMGEWFEANSLAEQVNGQYLNQLSMTVPSAANIVAYAEIVQEKSKLRKLIEVGTDLVTQAFSHGMQAQDISAKLATDAMALSGGGRIGGVKGMKDIGNRWFKEINKRYENKGGLVGLPTPWAKFNALTNGLKRGELVIVAGRPSMGKSAMAVNIATANALSGKRVLFFNLEMTDTSIYNRCIASIGKIPLSWLAKPYETDEDKGDYWPRVTMAVKQMTEAKMSIDDTAGLRREQIIARTRREHMRNPVDVVIVDHLHLIPLPGKTRETVEIGEITRDFKALAKELGCCFILLSQLNRALEQRQNKRPIMADLRESGNIEQDADLITFVYRDEYYAEMEGRESALAGYVEFIIAKQREGETGKVWAYNKLALGSIEECGNDYPKPSEYQAPLAKTRGMK